MRIRAFVLPDAVMGIAIMSVLTGIVVVAMAWRAEAGRRLANLRSATAEAELVLSEIHDGQPTDIPVTSKEVRLDYPPGGAMVPGYIWVRVAVTRGGQSASLLGLAKIIADGAK
jgi:hypothetical protein